MTTPVYNRNGKYWGFLYDGGLFSGTGQYKGWIDQANRVWNANGKYLGDLTDENYVLRKQSMAEPAPQVPPPELILTVVPSRKENRNGRETPAGMIDALF